MLPQKRHWQLLLPKKNNLQKICYEKYQNFFEKEKEQKLVLDRKRYKDLSENEK